MPRVLWPALATLAALHLGGCERSKVQEPDQAGGPPRSVASAVSIAPAMTLSAKLSRPAPERLVAIGDLHGDLDHTRRVLRLAGAVDDHDRWIGGRLVLVQTGDEV